MARPATLYQDWMPEKLELLRKEGKTITQICSEWNMNRDSYYRFKKEHPEFDEADKVGWEHFQAWLETQMQDLALNGDKNGRFKPLALMLNNHGKRDYGMGERAGGTQINIQNNVQITQQSASELQELLKKNLSYLTNNNIIDASYLQIEQKEDKDENADY